MRELVAEILLRLLKPLLAALLAMLLWVVLVGAAGAAHSVELALLCWLAAAAFVLLAQESPL
jgi:hypothetical protein